MDGQIYVLGGENEDTEVLLTMEVFDPHLNNWTTQTSMTTVRKVGQKNTSVSVGFSCLSHIWPKRVRQIRLCHSSVWLLCYNEEEAVCHGRRVLRENL